MSYSNHTFSANKIISSILLFLILAVSYSCSQKTGESKSKFHIKDDAGIELSFGSNPKRIISLAPNITETLYLIGADTSIVGVTDFCDYPPEAKNKPSTGSYISPDFEKMVSLNPDLIIMNVESLSNPTYQALKDLGMKIFVSNAKDIKGIEKMITDFGKITGKEMLTDSLLSRIRNDVSELSSKGKVSADPALIIISVNPLMTTNGKTFINDILNLSGISNLYKDESLDYPNISYEDVVLKNPEFIIFPADTSDTMKSGKFTDEIKRQLGKTNAVVRNRIILIDDDIMFRPGPRFLIAANALREKLVSAVKDGN